MQMLVVMTNRPSGRMPDAEYGLRLVGLEGVPLVGYGEIEWLAEQMGEEADTLSKPSPIHALAAVFAALSKELNGSLLDAYAVANGKSSEIITLLDESQIWVFEDTPAGIVSVDQVGKILHGQGINVDLNKIGIASTPLKEEYLKAQGVQVYEKIDMVLKGLF